MSMESNWQVTVKVTDEHDMETIREIAEAYGVEEVTRHEGKMVICSRGGYGDRPCILIQRILHGVFEKDGGPNRESEFFVEWTDQESDPLEDENGFRARIVNGKIVGFMTTKVTWEEAPTLGWGLPLEDAR